MTEFQAYEFTDVDNLAAWTAEPTLRARARALRRRRLLAPRLRLREPKGAWHL